MKLNVSCISLALSLMLGSCTMPRKLEPISPERFGLAVKFVAGAGEGMPATVKLIKAADGSVLASEISLFSVDAVQAVGEPSGDRFVVLASPSGNTILVHEDASDASPDEQIILFRRSKVDGVESWQAARYWPPQRPGPLYGLNGKSIAINDSKLLHQFLREEVIEIRFEKLRRHPEGDH